MARKTIHDILLQLDGRWDYIVRNPLSQQDVLSIEEQVGLPMPDCLREFLLQVGLFQDLVYVVFSKASEFAKHRRYLLDMSGHEGANLFPFLDDDGDILALRAGDTEDGRIYYFNHEICAVKRELRPPFAGIEPFFQDLIDDQVSLLLRNFQKRSPNTAKSWYVQFTFSLSDPEVLFAVMRQTGIIQIPTAVIWRNPQTSVAGVVSTETELVLDGQPISFGKSEYVGWDTPSYFFDMNEPVSLYSAGSKIRLLDKIFSQHDLGYKLVDYGILDNF